MFATLHSVLHACTVGDCGNANFTEVGSKCISNFTLVGNDCLHHSDEQMAYDLAKDRCWNMGSRVVEFRNEHELIEVRDEDEIVLSFC